VCNATSDDIPVVTAELDQLYLCSDQRAVTGCLASHPDSRDVKFIQLSITFHGAELLSDTKLDLNNGRRYGLIGLNGCGKSPPVFFRNLTLGGLYWVLRNVMGA